jgi:hypothetical protein
MIVAGATLEAIRIGIGMDSAITNPDTTQAILGWTGVTIALGVLSLVLVSWVEKAVQREQ